MHCLYVLMNVEEEMMKNLSKRMWIFVSILLLLVVLRMYYAEFSNRGILNHVMSLNGYKLEIIQENVPIELYITPEMITLNKYEIKEVNQKLKTASNTEIILDIVQYKTDEISFSFTTQHNMGYLKGEFLHNSKVQDNGTVSITSFIGEVELYDPNGHEIDVGGTSVGPEADFSFGIPLEDIDKIKDGFYVKYYGFMLYSYSKTFFS